MLDIFCLEGAYLSVFEMFSLRALTTEHYVLNKIFKMGDSKLFTLKSLIIFGTLTLSTLSQANLSFRNPCTTFGECSQICLGNNSGCACMKGFKLGLNQQDCYSEKSEKKILFSGVNQLGFVDRSIHNLGKSTMLYSSQSGINNYHIFEARATSYDARNRLIFWVNHQPPESVYRTRIDNPQELPDVIYNGSLKMPTGTAFDWITGNLYFTDFELGKIFVCRSDSLNNCAVIFSDNSTSPYGIALHPNLGTMFWVDYKSGIYQASMDGSQVKPVITSNISWPRGLCIDQGGARLYWTSGIATKGQIESANFDGSERRVIIEGNNQSGQIDVFEDSIYWASWFSSKLETANKFNGSGHRVLWDGLALGDLHGASIFSSANQPTYISDPCENNTRCPDICVLTYLPNSSVGYHCLDRMPPDEPDSRLSEWVCNKSNCSPLPRSSDFPENPQDSENIIVVTKKMMAITPSLLESKTNLIYKMRFPKIEEIIGASYNVINSTLIVASAHEVFEYHPDNSKLTTLLRTEQDQEIISFDVDNVGGNLYWINGGLKTVEIMSLRSHVRFVMMESMTNLCGIRVIPDKRSLLITRENTHGDVEILNFTLSGTQLLSVNHLPKARLGKTKCTELVLDEHGYIMWTPSGSSIKVISACIPDAWENPQIISFNSTVVVNSKYDIIPGSLAKLNKSIYWVDSISNELMQCNVDFLKSEISDIKSIRFLSQHEMQYGIDSITRLTIFSKNLRRRLGKNLAEKDQCEHVHLASGECVCSPGFRLMDNGKSCEFEEGLLNANMYVGVLSEFASILKNLIF